MPANIEIKARVHDFTGLQSKAQALSDKPCQVISMVDTFFNCPHGRIKLRELDPQLGKIVFYHRPDINGPKRSDYQIVETHDPVALKAILSQAFGVRGVVSKVRYLYMVGQTRIHLDDVDGLGKFVELEVVLSQGQADAEGQAIAEKLMKQLGIDEMDLIASAYMDLLEK